MWVGRHGNVELFKISKLATKPSFIFSKAVLPRRALTKRKAFTVCSLAIKEFLIVEIDHVY